MMSLLDQYVPKKTPFRPATPAELFALRLAQKLDDAPAVAHYADLVGLYSESQVLSAYRRAVRHSASGNRARQFFAELASLHPNGGNDGSIGILAVRVDRRTVAAAVFRGSHLEYTDSRQLSSDRERAIESSVGFVNWMLNRFQVESAALETVPDSLDVRRQHLHGALCAALRDRMLPIWDVPKVSLLEGCGHPALKTRSELREIATAIWPVVEGTRAKVFIQDAAILGLHVQTERLFRF